MNKSFVYLLLLFITSPVLAVDKSVLTKDWQHTSLGLYLTAQEAYDMKTADPEKVLFLDVRNQPEIHYTGMADTVDANIPYRFDSTDWKMKKKGIYGTFKKPKNPDFAVAVETLLQSRNLSKDSPVIIMCTSGSRAPFAAKILIKQGFTKVYTQVEGFEGKRAKTGPRKGERIVGGWKNVGLPWSYNLLPEKMYFNFDPQHVKESR
ncbi:MAG: sulfurtransferase [Proteobacteria bacterium]|nr:sulfurtransferase [Pseudomonadota bacterium]